MPKRINPDGLTDDEFGKAQGLAIRLMRRDGVTEFYIQCQYLAKQRALTRKQLDRLCWQIRQPPKVTAPRTSPIVRYRSRRHVTLAPRA